MQRQGKNVFLPSFAAAVSSPSLPSLAKKTRHNPYPHSPVTTPKEEENHTLPPLMQVMRSHLTLRRGKGKVPLSSCAYKYREEGQNEEGEKGKKKKGECETERGETEQRGGEESNQK